MYIEIKRQAKKSSEEQGPDQDKETSIDAAFDVLVMLD